MINIDEQLQQNKMRAARGMDVVIGHVALLDDTSDQSNVVAEVITDILHYAEQENLLVFAILEKARERYVNEITLL